MFTRGKYARLSGPADVPPWSARNVPALLARTLTCGTNVLTTWGTPDATLFRRCFSEPPPERLTDRLVVNTFTLLVLVEPT